MRSKGAGRNRATTVAQAMARHFARPLYFSYSHLKLMDLVFKVNLEDANCKMRDKPIAYTPCWQQSNIEVK